DKNFVNCYLTRPPLLSDLDVASGGQIIQHLLPLRSPIRFALPDLLKRIQFLFGHSASPVAADNRRAVLCSTARSFNAIFDSPVRGFHHVPQINQRPITQPERPASGMV